MLVKLGYLVSDGMGLFRLSRHFELKSLPDRVEVFYCGRQVAMAQAAQRLGGLKQFKAPHQLELAGLR